MRKIIFVLFFLSTAFCYGQREQMILVHFAFNKYDLDAEARNKLDSVLKNDSIMRVKINAHCDSIGNNIYNDALSMKRAMEIKNYLVEKKLNEEVISMKGSGKRIPLTNNADEKARALNRRAEIIFVIKNPAPVAPKTVTVPKPLGDSAIVESPAPPPVKEKPKDIRNLNMDSVQVGSTFNLSNLNFVGGRHLLLGRSKPTLELLLDIMRKNPTLKIEIDGYVCCTPDDKDGLDIGTGNYDLSLNRAKTVYNYLVENGIERKRLTYFGFGGSHKLVFEATEDDRETNRRVEIKILKK